MRFLTAFVNNSVILLKPRSILAVTKVFTLPNNPDGRCTESCPFIGNVLSSVTTPVTANVLMCCCLENVNISVFPKTLGNAKT